MRAPGDGRAIAGLGASATALVVEEQLALAAIGDAKHLREQIVVVCARATVEDQETRSALRAPGGPIQRDIGCRRETGRGGRRDRRHAIAKYSGLPAANGSRSTPLCCRRRASAEVEQKEKPARAIGADGLFQGSSLNQPRVTG